MHGDVFCKNQRQKVLYKVRKQCNNGEASRIMKNAVQNSNVNRNFYPRSSSFIAPKCENEVWPILLDILSIFADPGIPEMEICHFTTHRTVSHLPCPKFQLPGLHVPVKGNYFDMLWLRTVASQVYYCVVGNGTVKSTHTIVAGGYCLFILYVTYINSA